MARQSHTDFARVLRGPWANGLACRPPGAKGHRREEEKGGGCAQAFREAGGAGGHGRIWIYGHCQAAQEVEGLTYRPWSAETRLGCRMERCGCCTRISVCPPVFGIKVGELAGDSQMTKQQVSEIQIIVTTPEKWDLITRKSTDTSYTNPVRLIIIDQIHLLHDDRGSVLEAIVSRTIPRMEQTNDYVRLVGLSATLSHYQDAATFLRVDEKKGLFCFDATYRPCALQQQFVGITEKAIKRSQIMNEVCYEKVLDQAGKNQTLAFVHSRITQFVKPEGATHEILTEESSNAKDPSLRDLLLFGFAIHHAGMSREDRTLAEDLFSEGHVQVLVSMATLAWGVNLPAHSVIIKSTQIYNPEKGRWAEPPSQDVLHMLERVGRPQYDTFGEGVIITNHQELQHCLSLLNQHSLIESQFVAKLAVNLNAEVVPGTIRNRDEAVQWLGYTYLYVRMRKDPGLYGVGIDYQDEAGLTQKREDIVHSAAVLLEKCQLIKYEHSSGRFQSTELNKIASHCYATYNSMMVYNKHLKPSMSTLELFCVFALLNGLKLISGGVNVSSTLIRSLIWSYSFLRATFGVV
ncbi:P-loop containing nucleoside triphosphate hydrolase protein [Macrolepiota fuliginosa MF-IS2]|uniref:P-loop containing nucleoside triphosphate hydrolase protein n=1 Tax=Macrolepiota fuliginosa MF-IS2 TaxID=1400762 RepID=A0A9P5X0G1_9AGAR|nr:P-loop containing nucleoside triphosphate hydrolase protein [Macrolepiota fuliginosa MF-IS2]